MYLSHSKFVTTTDQIDYWVNVPGGSVPVKSLYDKSKCFKLRMPSLHLGNFVLKAQREHLKVSSMLICFQASGSCAYTWVTTWDGYRQVWIVCSCECEKGEWISLIDNRKSGTRASNATNTCLPAEPMLVLIGDYTYSRIPYSLHISTLDWMELPQLILTDTK